MKKIAIFAATDWEVGDVVKTPEFQYKLLYNKPIEVWENPTRYLIITRIGLAPASIAFSWAAQNLDFDLAINIGAVGAAAEGKSHEHLGKYYDITKVSCIEPYCDEESFEIEQFETPAAFTATLATASRPVISAEDRAFAAKFGELVDMEGWALAKAAKTFSKRLRMRKILSDFSPDCDLHGDIMSICKALPLLENFWI